MVSSRSKSRKGQATRRVGKRATKVLTIPELKQSFDAVETGVKDILKRGDTNEKQIKAFQALWRSVFHRTISNEAAEGYLRVKRGAPVAGPKKTRKAQRGGAPLAGAPLDYMTRPGVDGVHGNFPTYQAQGLSFYNTINKDGLFESCGKQDTTPVVPASIGDNRVMSGGATTPPAGVPRSIFDEMGSYFKGQPPSASPDPSETRPLAL